VRGMLKRVAQRRSSRDIHLPLSGEGKMGS
jgi:hypothetical protein